MDFSVYLKGQDFKSENPSHRASSTVVKLLISREYATPVGQNSIQLTTNHSWADLKRTVRTTHGSRSCGDLKCGQEKVYESIAIETSPKIHVGGLVRTEHKPEKFSQFRGARVGH